MPDSFDVDTALIAKLSGDATLAGLMPDGVYFDQAAPSKTRFVIVSLLDSSDEPMFDSRRAFEEALYLVKAVEQGSSATNTKAAAARIDALLDGQPLTVSGYTLMTMRRETRIRAVEVDPADETIRWQHRGGHYQVMVSA
jgi:hypothetical protein